MVSRCSNASQAASCITTFYTPIALSYLQIDDLFLATEEPFVTTNSYRMTPADSQALAAFQANVPSLPSGSSFRVLPCSAGC